MPWPFTSVSTHEVGIHVAGHTVRVRVVDASGLCSGLAAKKMARSSPTLSPASTGSKKPSTSGRDLGAAERRPGTNALLMPSPAESTGSARQVHLLAVGNAISVRSTLVGTPCVSGSVRSSSKPSSFTHTVAVAVTIQVWWDAIQGRIKGTPSPFVPRKIGEYGSWKSITPSPSRCPNGSKGPSM